MLTWPNLGMLQAHFVSFRFLYLSHQNMKCTTTWQNLPDILAKSTKKAWLYLPCTQASDQGLDIVGRIALQYRHSSWLANCEELTNEEAQAVYYTLIKHDRHFRIWGKCRQHEPQVSVFHISWVLSNIWSVIHGSGFSFALWCGFYLCKKIKHTFSMFYTLIKHGFLTNHNAHRVLSRPLSIL